VLGVLVRGVLVLGVLLIYDRANSKAISKKLSAASGEHFCFTNWQPIFSFYVAESHGDTATW